MMNSWDRLRGTESSERLWEMFHENSKATQLDIIPDNAAVLEDIAARYESLQYEQTVADYALPKPHPLVSPLDEVLFGRESATEFFPSSVDLSCLSSFLAYSSGITRPNSEDGYPRPFRCTPSAGAMYPLELYFFARDVESLPCGLYHYRVDRNEISLLRSGNHREELAEAMPAQRWVANGASIVFLITAIFERSTFKYGERGYRFALLEAGHLVQNINLVAAALEMNAVNLGGYLDRRLESYLGIDGVNHSLVYASAVGGSRPGATA